MLSPEASQSRAERNRWSGKEYLEDHPLHEALKGMLFNAAETNANGLEGYCTLSCWHPDEVRWDYTDRESVSGYISFHQGCLQIPIYIGLVDLHDHSLNKAWPAHVKARIEKAFRYNFLENVNQIIEYLNIRQSRFKSYEMARDYYDRAGDEFQENVWEVERQDADEYPYQIGYRVMLKNFPGEGQKLLAWVAVNFDAPYYRDHIPWLRAYGQPTNMDEIIWEDEITLDQLTPELIERWGKEMVECV